MLHKDVFTNTIPHLLFSTTKKKLNIYAWDNVLYLKKHVGKIMLHLLNKQLIENIHNLQEECYEQDR
jgi:hypothetical protein